MFDLVGPTRANQWLRVLSPRSPLFVACALLVGRLEWVRRRRSKAPPSGGIGRGSQENAKGQTARRRKGSQQLSVLTTPLLSTVWGLGARLQAEEGWGPTTLLCPRVDPMRPITGRGHQALVSISHMEIQGLESLPLPPAATRRSR